MLEQLKRSIVDLSRKLEESQGKVNNKLVTVWEIRVRDNLRWLNDELQRGQAHLHELTEGWETSKELKNQKQRKEFEKEIDRTQKRIQGLQKAKANRAETLALLGVKVATTAAAAIIPMAACTIM
jgi:lipid II:glycine glycyltransferase (peptidoglycan interpeptide bridge formation enzyme)